VAGCQADDPYPNFFLPKGSSFLEKNTWVCLDHFIEVNTWKFDDKRARSKIWKIGEIKRDETIQLLSCALACEDISGWQIRVVERMLGSFGQESEA
jgi:hypothetical protein